MTVEDLLERLYDERKNALVGSFMYGSEALESKLHEDHEDAEYYKKKRDQYDKEAERLLVIIKEIKKRVS